MDPGNWATDLAGGSQFGYKLLWVLLMSNVMALLLQSFAARLGIVRGRDLAQCNREVYPRRVNVVLYVLAELAIAATDLAEILGMAIGLQLLLGIPLLWGVLITLLDTFLLLYLQRLGMRKMEAFIIALVGIIGVCFLVEMILAQPQFSEVARGLIPSIPNNTALYIAIGIIGATVMPHNLYLHSALVQTRKIAGDEKSLRRAIRFNFWDSAIALNLAFFVNAAILILAASVFFTSGQQHVAALKDAHQLLAPMLGSTWAAHLFAIALIAAGQSSTITGTLAGQVVMEGYLQLRINPIMRRLITRLLAVVPAVLVILLLGEEKVDSMLVFSQVLLSMQLAFAVIPLLHFVSNKSKMGAFAIGARTKVAGWIVAAVIVVLNLKLVYESAVDGIEASGSIVLDAGIVAGGLGLLALLGVTIFYPLIRRRDSAAAPPASVHARITLDALETAPPKPFETVAVALDFSEKDALVLQYAQQLAQPGATIILIHIVESAQARRAGSATEDAETAQDLEQLERYAAMLSTKGFTARATLGYRDRAREIARIVEEANASLLVVGSHGHRALGDLLHGQTIDTVRHLLRIPVFIAQ